MTTSIYMPIIRTVDTRRGALSRLFEMDPGQRRPVRRMDGILMAVAQAKAADMAKRGYFGHRDPDGHGPNWLLRAAGYPLPGWYGRADDANNVESLAGGYPTAEDAWAGWLASERGHRRHALGESDFFRRQDEYGVGFVEALDSQWITYWVLISAERG